MATPNIFDFIIITAPTKYIANQYKNHLSRHQTNKCLVNLPIHCVADPDGGKIGSGGGTLHAIKYLITKFGYDVILSGKCLIIHSGGESRRAPIHSVCGKAWSSLNLSVNKDIVNPFILLINELSSFFGDTLMIGSLVIACCDVIVDIHRINRYVKIPSDTISIIAVPTDINIAKNHVSVMSFKFLYDHTLTRIYGIS